MDNDTSSLGRENKVSDGHGTSTKHGNILLGELVHLIGLFLVHSQNAESVRATDVLFDQMVRQLNLLSKMPGHGGGILIRRTHSKAPASPPDADYSAFFGDLKVSTSDDATIAKKSSHLKSTLKQAFQCFSEQDIHSLFLQMPEGKPKKIDQLRLAMNIMARFRSAVKDASSIRFRCYGRALTFSVIHDIYGKPNPNLTLTAALNGLSPVNARELIKQAYAFHKLNVSSNGELEASEPINSYNQIFAVRSLRPQIAKPPVEINNLPWLQVDTVSPSMETCQLNTRLGEKRTDKISDAGLGPPAAARLTIASKPSARTDRTITPDQCRQLIAPYIDPDGKNHHQGFNALVADDYGALEPLAIGERFILVTRLLYALDRTCQDPRVIESIIDLFQSRLRQVRDDVLSNIVAKRRSLKIIAGGRSIVVGMVHPRLFDVITLVTEHVVAARRMAIVQEIAFGFDPCHFKSLADGFGITDSEALHILKILYGCFTADGNFIRPTFEARIGAMTQYENVIFEILWCFLKETPRRQDRLNFLNAVQLLMIRLRNPKRATQFLLADICQTPYEVAFTDRNAICLANILLHQENRELYVDMNRTPEDVLNIQRRINQEVRQYAYWRLEVDRMRILSKLRTVHQFLLDALHIPSEDPRPFEVPFLVSLEREAIIFLAIAGGHAARGYLRELLEQYGNPASALFRQVADTHSISELMGQLRTVIRALGRSGTSEDVARLEALQDKADAFCRLVPHPAQTLRTKQSLKWIPDAVKMINLRA